MQHFTHPDSVDNGKKLGKKRMLAIMIGFVAFVASGIWLYSHRTTGVEPILSSGGADTDLPPPAGAYYLQADPRWSSYARSQTPVFSSFPNSGFLLVPKLRFGNALVSVCYARREKRFSDSGKSTPIANATTIPKAPARRIDQGITVVSKVQGFPGKVIIIAPKSAPAIASHW